MLEKKKRNYMKNNKRAKKTEEFDNRFDQGEDIHDLLDMSQARISRPGQRVRITLDVAEELIKQRVWFTQLKQGSYAARREIIFSGV